MKKQKIHLEYMLDATSKSLIWSAIGTASGLQNWFADEVTFSGKIATFKWGKTEEKVADIIAMRLHSFIRFRWREDAADREYFELKMNYNELTNDYELEITDFAYEEDIDDLRELWDSQVETLRRTCGF